MRTLKANLEVYLQELPALLADHKEGYALICRGQIYTYETAELATTAGLEKCGNAHDFLVLKIEPPPSETEGDITHLRNLWPAIANDPRPQGALSAFIPRGAARENLVNPLATDPKLVSDPPQRPSGSA